MKLHGKILAVVIVVIQLLSQGPRAVAKTNEPEMAILEQAAPASSVLQHARVPELTGSDDWQMEVAGSSGNSVGSTSMVLDLNGYPHIAYQDLSAGVVFMHAYLDDAGWHTEPIHNAADSGYMPNLAVDANNRLHAAWRDGPSRSVMYAYRDDTGWHRETVHYGVWPKGMSLALDSSNHPHISYWTDGQGNDDVMHAWHDGASWHIEMVRSTAHYIVSTSIAMDSNDNAHIAYGYDGDDTLNYAWYDAGWHFEIVHSYAAGNLYGGLSLSLDAADRARIAYHNSATSQLDYFVRDGSTWQRSTVGSAHGMGRLVVDSTGRSHIGYLYNNGVENEIRYAYQAADTWRLETIATGQGPSLTLDSSDVPQASFGASDGAWYARRATGTDAPWLTAVPSSVPADGVSASTVTLSYVAPGHKVRLISSRGSVDTFADAVGRVGSNGQYATTIRSATPGTAILTARDLTTGESFATSTGVTFTPVGEEPIPPPPNGEFDFVVNSDFSLGGRFLEGLSLPNRVSIRVPWPNEPGEVIIKLNESSVATIVDPNAAGWYEHIVDMGTHLLPGRNTVQIVAQPPNGPAVIKTFSPWSWPTPTWLEALQNFGLAGPLLLVSDGALRFDPRFEATFTIPPKPFEARVDFGIIGKKAGVYPTHAFGTLRVPLLPERTGSIEGGVKGGFQLGDGVATLQGALKAEGQWRTEPPFLLVERAGLGLAADWEQEIYRESILATLLALSPGLGTAVKKLVTELGIEQYLQRYGWVYLDGIVRLSGDSSIALEPYVHPEWLRVGGALGIEGGVRIYIKPAIELHAYVGGDGEAQVDSDPSLHISRLAIVGKAGVELIAFWFKTSAEGRIEWVYPEPASRQMSAAPPHSRQGAWELLPHPSGGEYAVFRSGTSSNAWAASTRRGIAALTPVTSTLVSNVFTYTVPSIAVDPLTDEALLLWVRDVITKPMGQAHEIQYSCWDGSLWSTPAGLTDDNMLDGGPQVAWAHDGTGVAVWQRLNDTLPVTATLDVTTAKQIEIATASYDPASHGWSPVAWLTTNDALDVTPQLVGNSSGQLLAVWRRNDAGLVVGDGLHPDSIVAAFHDTIWLTPVVAIDSIPGLVDLAAGRGDNHATIAYTRYLTPTGYPTPTLQLFTSTWNGMDWSPPVQLTDDAVGHRHPQVAYTSANEPVMIWLAGNEVRLRNLTTGSAVGLALPPGIGVVDEFRVVQDQSGNLAAVLTAQGRQRDLYVSFYDQEHNLWGMPTPLTTDRRSEGYPAPGMDSAGHLLMAYASTAVADVTHTTTISATGETVTYTIPTEGRTDLVTLSRVFSRNLTLRDADLVLSDDRPTPGGRVVLSGTVHNSGDLALDGVTVGFYDGDPALGGIPISTAQLSAPLSAGFSATLTAAYTVPITGGAHVLYAIADPADIIGEADESDNVASLAALGPDLEIAVAPVEYWGGADIGLLSLVRNIGTSAAPTSTLAFRSDAVTGTLLVTDHVPILAAGAAITLTTPWNLGPLTEGSYPIVGIVNQLDFTETFTSNNLTTFALDVRPDLMTSPYYVWTTPLTETNAMITATVFNVGPITATDVTVGLYRRGSLDPSSLLVTHTLPVLPPASAAVITDQVAGPLGCGLYVLADPAQAITETTRANNLASIISPDGRCAGFWCEPASGIRPFTVVFTDTSTGENTGWLWEFGDGYTSTLQMPSHEYTTSGIYSVTLQVTGPDGADEVTRRNAVVVYEPAVAGFDASPTSGIAPLQVSFSDESLGDIVAWKWEFGDGSGSPVPDPTHLYEAAGVYTVSLTVGGPGGTDSFTRTNYVMVYEPVLASFTASPTFGEAPLTVGFTNTSTGDFSSSMWDFGDGSTSTQHSPTHVYADAGSYTITLTMSGPGGTDTMTRTEYVRVEERIAGLDALNDSPTRLGNATTLTATITAGSDVSYTWALGDGYTTSGAVITHTYPLTGSYTAVVTASNGVSWLTATTTVAITPPGTQIYLPLVLRRSTG